ncbi:MAG: hypothetical protein IKO68_08305 [Oscillospiraceae bacterium]|nr:hypothetical protein [Oscillospiraceae bacterium]
MGGRGSSSSIGPRPGAGGPPPAWTQTVGIKVADNLKDAIGKKGPEKTVGDAMIASNPYYSPDYREYSENCQRVVVAYEARRRGYDVTALPTFNGDTLSGIAYNDTKNGIRRGRWMGAFQGAEPVNVSSSTERGVLNNIDKQMANYGEGSRGVVQIFYKGGGGHVFNVERKNGKTTYIEAQVGKVKNFGDTLKNVKTGEVALVRTDNLKLSDRARNFVTQSNGG